MDQFQRKQSVRTVRYTSQHNSPSSRRSDDRQKTSMLFRSSKINQKVSQKRQFERIKLIFRKTATQYYNTEVQNILKDEVKKIKEKQKLQNMIDIIKSPEYVENARTKHHQRVAQVAERVKHSDLQKSIIALDKYLKKKQTTQNRVNSFILSKKQRIFTSSLATQRTCIVKQSPKSMNSSIIIGNISITDRKKPIIKQKCSKSTDQERKEKLLFKQKQQEQIKINSFMYKMKQANNILAKKQIEKQIVFTEKKNTPVKCFTNLRNSRNESRRQLIQKHYQQKNKSMASKLMFLHRSKQQSILNKSQIRQSHCKTVLERRKKVGQQQNQLKISKVSKFFNSSVIFKQYQHQNVQKMKKQFKLKKQYQQEKNTILMRKLVNKIRDLKMVESKVKLPETNIQNFNRLLNQIVDNAANTELFEQTKYKAARKIVSEEQANNKLKKMHKNIK